MNEKTASIYVSLYELMLHARLQNQLSTDRQSICHRNSSEDIFILRSSTKIKLNLTAKLATCGAVPSKRSFFCSLGLTTVSFDCPHFLSETSKCQIHFLVGTFITHNVKHKTLV